MKTDNLFKSLISNTIIIFIIIVILMLVITYLSFKKIETYKFLIAINVIAGIIIFILLSMNDHFKCSSGYNLLSDNNPIIDENKVKYFNNILDNNIVGGDNIKGNTLDSVSDDIDKQIENIIKEIQ